MEVKHFVRIDQTMGGPKVSPPKSWSTPNSHFLTVLHEPWYKTVMHIQSTVSVATTEFWIQRGAQLLCLPITTGSVSSPNAVGSDSIPVPVSIFGVHTYLADSMQFLLEYGCRLSPEGCFYLMPSFRGEDVDSSHLAQFFHSEVELVGTLDDVMEAAEDYIRFLASRILERHDTLVMDAAGTIEHLKKVVQTLSFPRISFSEAIELLGDNPEWITINAVGGRIISRKGEQRLMQTLGSPVWLTKMDHLSVPFYQAFDGDDLRTARNADLLMGIGEILGAGERHASIKDARHALEVHSVSEVDYEWYLMMKELYPLRTAGFGMGVERFLLWVLQHDDIRDIPLLLRVNGQQINP